MSKFTHIVYVESREMCMEIECELDYSAEEGDGWHLPRIPEEAELISAKIGGIDIYKALTKDQIAAIEQDALVDHGTRLAEDEAERRWDARVGDFE